jgi:hypothetical protein
LAKVEHFTFLSPGLLMSDEPAVDVLFKGFDSIPLADD